MAVRKGYERKRLNANASRIVFKEKMNLNEINLNGIGGKKKKPAVID